MFTLRCTCPNGILVRALQRITTRPTTPNAGCSSTRNVASAGGNVRGWARWAERVGWASWVWWVGVCGLGCGGVGWCEVWGARYLATPPPTTHRLLLSSRLIHHALPIPPTTTSTTTTTTSSTITLAPRAPPALASPPTPHHFTSALFPHPSCHLVSHNPATTADHPPHAAAFDPARCRPHDHHPTLPPVR